MVEGERMADDLRAILERLRQAAEQYLDTEHRSDQRDVELRYNLSEAALDAALVLHRVPSR